MFSIPLVIIAGALLIESYFGIPGVGKITYEAIITGDQPVLKAVVSLTAIAFVLMVGLPFLYRAVDPRVTLNERRGPAGDAGVRARGERGAATRPAIRATGPAWSGWASFSSSSWRRSRSGWAAGQGWPDLAWNEVGAGARGSLTRPGRARTFSTGRSPHRHGLRDRRDRRPLGDRPRCRTRCLAGWFAAAGSTTRWCGSGRARRHTVLPLRRRSRLRPDGPPLGHAPRDDQHVLDRHRPPDARRSHQAEDPGVRARGAFDRRAGAAILARHVLPNTAHILLVQATIIFVGAIKTEVILSFLGLGVNDGVSWGLMIDESTKEVLAGFYNNFLAASVMMFGLLMAFNLLADALQDALDPRKVG